MTTEFRYQNVKHFKRGAKWGDGETRTCTVCRINIKKSEKRGRAKAAVVTAEIRKLGSRFKTPVGYCEQHIPEEIL